MSRISRALARRVDRLSRRAHAFHRLSHHPLCDRYAGDLVRLGRRRRVCRGCLFTLGGAVAGAAAGLALPPVPPAALLAVAGLLLALVPAAIPSRRPSGRGSADPARPAKLATRFLPVATAVAVAAQGLARPGAGGLLAALASAGAVGWAVRRYRRRGPDRAPCADCPEGPPGAACPGFAPIVARERAFRRLAGRWIAAERATPPHGRGRQPHGASPRSGSRVAADHRGAA
ncbi:MAG TPA: hypothetical protein VML50_08940 [Anaeromyxobacter sp.]|nr:hypothetical protein [Anaeromyxobacter sp.]